MSSVITKPPQSLGSGLAGLGDAPAVSQTDSGSDPFSSLRFISVTPDCVQVASGANSLVYRVSVVRREPLHKGKPFTYIAKVAKPHPDVLKATPALAQRCADESLIYEARALQRFNPRLLLEKMDLANFTNLHERREDGTCQKLTGSRVVLLMPDYGDMTLARRLDPDQKPLTPLETTKILHSVCSALGSIHGLGGIHGDVKADNVMLPGPHDMSLAQLVDYGTVHIGDRTKNKSILGHKGPRVISSATIRAPEVWRDMPLKATDPLPGERNPDGNFSLSPYSAKADIWSFGTLGYRMLTHTHFIQPTNDSVVALYSLSRKLGDPPPEYSEVPRWAPYFETSADGVSVSLRPPTDPLFSRHPKLQSSIATLYCRSPHVGVLRKRIERASRKTLQKSKQQQLEVLAQAAIEPNLVWNPDRRPDAAALARRLKLLVSSMGTPPSPSRLKKMTSPDPFKGGPSGKLTSCIRS